MNLKPKLVVEPASLVGSYVMEHRNHDCKLLRRYMFNNGITTIGFNSLLDSLFRNVAHSTNWYMGLIDATSYSALAAGDLMSSHAGWIEATAYTQSARPQWTVGAAAGAGNTNAAVVVFTMNAIKTLEGVFLTDIATKGGTTGILWSTALFGNGSPAPITVAAADTLSLTYSLGGS